MLIQPYVRTVRNGPVQYNTGWCLLTLEWQSKSIKVYYMHGKNVVRQAPTEEGFLCIRREGHLIPSRGVTLAHKQYSIGGRCLSAEG